MTDKLVFYFDFASPYSYIAFPAIEEIASEWKREIDFRPVLVWTILKARGIVSPLEQTERRNYFHADMKRSAEYFGMQYHHPDLPISAHLAARLFCCVAEDDPARAVALARDLFAAFFAKGEKITQADVIAQVASRHGIAEKDAQEMMTGARGRTLLAASNEQALADGAIGVPFFLLDGETFFGADRLPQIVWRLASAAQKTEREP